MRSRWWPAALMIMLAAMIGLICWTLQRADRDMRKNLLQQTRMIAQSLNIQRIQSLTGTAADHDNPDYLRLQEQLTSIRSTNKKCQSLHIVGRRNDERLLSLVDNETADPQKAQSPMPEEALQLYRQVFDTKADTVSGPVNDSRGTWVSAVVPLMSPDKDEPIALLGMNVDAHTWKWDIAAHAALPGGLMLSLLFLAASEIFAAHLRVNAWVKPIQVRMMIPLTAVLMLLLGIFGFLQAKQLQYSIDQSGITAQEEVSRDMKTLLNEQAQGLGALGQILLRDQRLPQALAAGDRNRLLDSYAPVFATLKASNSITHFYFINRDRICLLRVNRPEGYGDVIDRFTLREAERTGKAAVGLELDLQGHLTLWSVQPVYDGSALVGYVELGKEIEDILTDLQRGDKQEITVLIHKEILRRQAFETGKELLKGKSQWDRFPAEVLIYSSLQQIPVELEPFINKSGHAQTQTASEVEFGGQSWQALSAPVADASGGLDAHTARKLDFYTRQFVDAMSPSNFLLTNPEVLRKTAETGGENLIKGLNNLLSDLERDNFPAYKVFLFPNLFKVDDNVEALLRRKVLRDGNRVGVRGGQKLRAVKAYVPGYRLKQNIQFERFGSNNPVHIPGLGDFEGLKTSIFLEVEGAAHYLPAYAGNLDIMTSAALRTAEKIAGRMRMQQVA